MNPRVSIVILNWNGWKDTIECLESLYQINYLNYDVILVDNKSDDNSIEKIRDYCNGKIKVKSNYFKYDSKNKPIKISEYTNDERKSRTIIDTNIHSEKKLILIKNNKNYGFAEGNNIAINFALNSFDSDYILLLNNDTVVDKNFLNESVSVAESNEKFAIVGSKVYFYDIYGKNNIIQSIGGKIEWNKFPGYYHMKVIEKNNLNVVERDWVTGAVMLMKIKEMEFKSLNNEFFFGCEDIDLCIKLKKRNYKIVVALNSMIWHKAGVSRRKKYQNPFNMQLTHIKTNLKFIKKHNNKFYLSLPLYFCQISYSYLNAILNRIFKFC